MAQGEIDYGTFLLEIKIYNNRKTVYLYIISYYYSLFLKSS